MKGSNHEISEDLEEWSEDYSGEAIGERFKADHVLPVAPLQADFLIGHEQAGLRLDVFLAQIFQDLSRSQLQRWIAQAHVLVNDAETKPGQVLREGQRVRVSAPEPQPVNDWGPEPILLQVVFEDADLIVIDKPAGLVVHPAAGHPGGTLANGLIARCPEVVSVPRAGIVHRLDRDTSGLLVAAKTVAAQLSLVRQLQERTVSRQYLALAWGRLAAQTVSTHMGRDPRDRQRMAVLPGEKGKEAVTRFEPLSQGMLFGQEVTLARCILETGRTHQIRVHAEHIRHPLVGDRTYHRHSPHANRLAGGKKSIEEMIPGQALHAQRLSFVHPRTLEKISFAVAAPQAFAEVAKLAGIRISPDGDSR